MAAIIESGSTVIDPETGLYTRSSSIERSALQQTLTDLYTKGIDPGLASTYKCLTYPSGMSSIHSTVHCVGVKNPGSIFVIGNELFPLTPKAFDLVCSYTLCRTIKVHVLDNQTIIDTFREHGNLITLFFIESCSNPSGFLFDWSLIPQLRVFSPQCLICVDNTWLSPVLFNPFHHGVDIVVDSLTKYFSGSKRIGGSAVTSHPIFKDLDAYSKVTGLNYCSSTCKAVAINLPSLEARMIRVSTVMEQILAFLRTQPKVTRIHHPGARPELNSLNAGVVCFHVGTKRRKRVPLLIRKFLTKPSFRFETSYGAPYSKIDSHLKYGLSNDRDYIKKADAVEGIWPRLAVGYESDPAVIIETLGAIIHAV